MERTTKVLVVCAALAVIALSAVISGCCGGGSSDSTSSSTSSTSSAATEPSGGADIAAEIASKGAAATVRDRLKAQTCDSTGHFKTPYIDYRDEVRPYAGDKVLYGSWIDPNIPELDSSNNDKVRSLAPDDLDWYGALDSLCKDSTQCQGDVCELTEPDIYSKTRVEVRVIDGQPKIVAVYRGTSMGGANTPLLETAYSTFVTTVTAQLPPGSAPAAAPAAAAPAEGAQPAAPADQPAAAQ